MIVQVVSIPGYHWKIKLYYAVTEYWTDLIMDDLRSIGIEGKDEFDAYDNLSSGELDNGITYSNEEFRKSIIVVAKTSSGAEFFNSINHELDHLGEQIFPILGIEFGSEEAAYFKGNLALKIFPKVSHLMCECCRKKMKIEG